MTSSTYVDYHAPGEGTYYIRVKARNDAGTWGHSQGFQYVYGLSQTPTATVFKPINNVFNPKSGKSMTLNYSLATSGHVRAALYTLQGEPVKVLVDQEQGVGTFSVPWTGVNEGGLNVASGIYLLYIAAPGVKQTMKVAVLR